METNNNQWYNTLHKWLQANFIKPNKCELPDCEGGGSRIEWALIKGHSYSRSRSDYIAMCSRCHRFYDNHCGLGGTAAESRKQKVCYLDKNNNKKCFPSINEASSSFGLVPTSISNNLNGRSKSAGGVLWFKEIDTK